MNRRNFLKRLGMGAAVAAVGSTVLPAILTPSVTSTTYSTYIVGKDSILTLADVRAAKESLIKMQVLPQGPRGFIGWVHPEALADIYVVPPVRIRYTLQAAPPVRGQRLRFIDA